MQPALDSKARSIDEFDVQVINVMGQLVDFAEAQIVDDTKIRLNLSNLNSGIYFVRIHNDILDKTLKVVKE